MPSTRSGDRAGLARLRRLGRLAARRRRIGGRCAGAGRDDAQTRLARRAPSGAGFDIKVFFLGCVIVAGVYGAATVGRKILFVQALPAAIALALVLVAY